MNPHNNAGTLASQSEDGEHIPGYGAGSVHEIPYPRELRRGNYCWQMRYAYAMCNGTSLIPISVQ